MKNNYINLIKGALGALVFAGVVSTDASAQCELLNETFSSSLGTFTAANGSSGNWGFTSSCASSSAGGHTAPGSALFSGSGCQFGNGGNTVSGNLTSQSVYIPASGGTLSFNYRIVNECGSSGSTCYYDRLTFQLSSNGGGSWTTIADSYTNYGNGQMVNGGWNSFTYNLSSYANQNILIRFNFNSLDGIGNAYDGIYVDDVKIIALCPYDNDAGIAGIINPGIPTCDLDSVDVTVQLQNLGLDTLTNCTIKWQVNSGTVNSFAYTGSVDPIGGLDTVILTNTSFSNFDDLVVWTEMPNGVQDSIPSNDTLAITLATGLSGTYTIPGDYASFNAAVDDLHSFGVCGDVVFNVASGTYTEQLSINDILGVSENATITFQGANANWNSSVLTSSTSPTIAFNGGDWITFKNLKLVNTSGNVVSLPGQSDHVTIDSCWMKGVSGTSTNTQALVLMDGTPNDFSLTNNKMEKGASWFYSTSGSTTLKKQNLTVNNNLIKDQSYYGGYLYYFDGIEFNYNTIKNDSAFQYGYGYYAMGYWYYCDNFNVTHNFIGATTGSGWYYAMYMYSCVGSSNPKSQISNNCITTGNETSSAAYYALYMSASGLCDIYNNTFNRSGLNNSYGIYIYSGGAINLKNNSIYSKGGGVAAYIYGGFTIDHADYNNYYTANGPLLYYGTAQYNSLEDYQNATGQGMHSVVTDPNFEDLMTCATCNDTLSNAGTPLVYDDINGVVRSAVTPDIGATEYINANSFTLGADDTICGNQVLVEAGAAQSVVWGVSENGGATQTFSTPSVTLTASGSAPSNFNVAVVISTEYCGNASDDVVLRLIPGADLDTADHICADESITLTPGGGSTATHAWSTGATTATIDVSEAGSYSVTQMEEGCESEATIVVSQSTAVEIADIEGCEADAPISIDATIPDGSSYAWSGGSAMTSAVNQFTASGAYNVTATDLHGCVSSSDFNLLVLGEPVAAIDYAGTGGTAFLFNSQTSQQISPNTTYLWTFNSIDTSTALNPAYVFPWNGTPTTYPVSLEIDNGCGTDLATMNITVDPIGVNEVENTVFSIYPNPTQDNVFITAGAQWSTLDVTVLDNAGRIVLAESFNGQQNIELNTKQLASGTYLVKMISDSNSEVHTLIVQ